MKILISGGTGFVGKALVKQLSESHEVILLSRDPSKYQDTFNENVKFLQWDDFYQEFDLKPFGKIDAVVNLIGENIASKRWSNEQKKLLFNSRVDATKTILKSIKSSQDKVDTFVSTSAVGIYADGFLKKVCESWESAVVEFGSDIISRSCILRVGMVLGKGGAMQRMLPLFKLGLGGKLGHGKQYTSWIHITDLVNIYESALINPKLNGAINAVSPFCVDNSEFTQVLAKILRKPSRFTVPSFALKLALGEMSTLMIDSVKVEPKSLQEENFHYLYPTIELALKEVVSKE